LAWGDVYGRLRKNKLRKTKGVRPFAARGGEKNFPQPQPFTHSMVFYSNPIIMTTLAEGQKAPAFSAADQNGKTVRLSAFKGQKLVLYFYPKDMTSTCTVQACNLRDHHKELIKKGWAVVGVSPDDEASHQKFISKHELPFTLLADTDQQILQAYGVWGEKSMYGRKYMGVIRTTFLIDAKGVIRHIIRKPQSAKHAQEILKLAADMD
jgi:peroxiredoxin Q/BCP